MITLWKYGNLKHKTMKPKDEALRIYNLMVVDFSIDKAQSKACALVCIDELLKYATKYGLPGDDDWYAAVKEEIEKL